MIFFQDDRPTNSPTLQSVVCQFLSIGCAGKTSLLLLPSRVISLHVLNGWVVTDIWCEFDVNLIFRNILEKPRKLVMCSIFRFPTSSFGPLE